MENEVFGMCWCLVHLEIYEISHDLTFKIVGEEKS